MIFDARLIAQFAVDNGRPVGFIVGAVDLVPLFRSFRGRLGPTEIIRLMWAARTRTRGGAVFGAVLPEYRGRHIATMAARFFRDLEEMGFTKALSTFSSTTPTPPHEVCRGDRCPWPHPLSLLRQVHPCIDRITPGRVSRMEGFDSQTGDATGQRRGGKQSGAAANSPAHSGEAK
jgi:hypothetical protein